MRAGIVVRENKPNARLTHPHIRNPTAGPKHSRDELICCVYF